MPLLHPSIRALLEADGGDDPFAAIRRRARAVVTEALALGWEGPPFDMTELASFRGLSVSESTGLANDQDACVTPGHVLVNAGKHRVRRRYSVAHEVGHTLFPDYEEELRRAGTLWRRDGDESEFERLCQAAAAEFLMPLGAFEAAVRSRGRTLAGVVTLADDFDASLEAAARRIVETAEDPMAAVLLRPRDAGSGAWLDVRPGDGHSPYAPLGVAYVCANDACGGLQISAGTRPPPQGAAERAWKRVRRDRRRTITIERRAGETWTQHAGVAGPWSSEAVALPLGVAVPHEVLCLIRRDATANRPTTTPEAT